MSLSDRLRRRFRGFRGRLTVELVRVEEPPPPTAPPRALPAPERPRRRSAGYAALYGRRLDADPYSSRPRPLGQGPAHDKALIRDQASAWRTGGPDLSAYPLNKDALYAELFPPRSPGGSSGTTSPTAHPLMLVTDLFSWAAHGMHTPRRRRDEVIRWRHRAGVPFEAAGSPPAREESCPSHPPAVTAPSAPTGRWTRNAAVSASTGTGTPPTRS